MEVQELAKVLAREIVMEYSSSRSIDNAADTAANIIEKVVKTEQAITAVELQMIHSRQILARERAIKLMQHYLAYAVKAAGLDWDSDNQAEAAEIVDCVIAAVGICQCNR